MCPNTTLPRRSWTNGVSIIKIAEEPLIRYDNQAQNISPGLSNIQASCSRATPFVNPSSIDMSASSCSIDIT